MKPVLHVLPAMLRALVVAGALAANALIAVSIEALARPDAPAAALIAQAGEAIAVVKR